MALPSVIFDLLDDWVTFKIFPLLFKLSVKIVSPFFFKISFNGSLFEIPDEPPCYVRQCSL